MVRRVLSLAQGNIDNLQELETGSFTIWGKVEKKKEAAQEDIVLDQCKKIAKQCFQMFLEDLQELISQGNTTSVISIDVNSFQLNKIGPHKTFYHGYRCQFMFTSKF